MTSPANSHDDHLVEILDHTRFTEPAHLAGFLVVRAGWSKRKVAEVFGLSRHEVERAVAEVEVRVEGPPVLTDEELLCMARGVSVDPYASAEEKAQVRSWIKAQSQRKVLHARVNFQSRSTRWEEWE